MANMGLKGFPLAPSFVALSNPTSSGTGNSGAYFGSSFSLKMATDIAANSAVSVGPDGLGYPVIVSDYAAFSAVATGNNTGYAVAGTTVVAGPGLVQADRVGLIQGANGDTFAVGSNDGNGYGIAIYRYSAAGALAGKLVVDAATVQFSHSNFALLSNGNLVLTYTVAGSARFVIVNQSLSLIKSFVAFDAQAVIPHGLIALADGGFLLTWRDGAVASTQNIAIYDNVGNVVVAKKAVYSAASATTIPRMAQLSDGNVVVCLNSVGAGNMLAVQIGVITVAGVMAVPFFAGETTNSGTMEVSALAGFFAVALWDGTSKLKVRVYTNAGAPQGALYNPACLSGSAGTIRLINDGVTFWLSYTPVASTQFLTRITTTAVTTEFNIQTGSSSNRDAQARYDMFFELGRLVIYCSYPDGGSFVMSVFNTLTLVQESVVILNGSMHSGANPKIIPGGDFTAIFLCNTGSYGLVYSVVKYAASSIAGVTAQAVSANNTGVVGVTVGSYGINRLKGSTAKAFDHSAAQIPGNKGTLLTYGAVLKGY